LNVDFKYDFIFRAIPFKYTWEGEHHLFQTLPTNRRRRKFHPPPPEKKIMKIISFIETPRASH
jgi:hypothetical protein